jgi:hypothetical protein
MLSQPTIWPRSKALSTPPAIDMCAPSFATVFSFRET